MNAGTKSVDEEIQKVLASSGTSYWLRNALEKALDRDCVDAVGDAEYLFDVLSRRLNPLSQPDAEQPIVGWKVEFESGQKEFHLGESEPTAGRWITPLVAGGETIDIYPDPVE